MGIGKRRLHPSYGKVIKNVGWVERSDSHLIFAAPAKSGIEFSWIALRFIQAT